MLNSIEIHRTGWTWGESHTDRRFHGTAGVKSDDMSIAQSFYVVHYAPPDLHLAGRNLNFPIQHKVVLADQLIVTSVP